MDIPEDELLAAIRKVVSGPGPEVVVGPGDDAAVVSSGSGELVLTTDALVEDVHFRRDLTTPRDLGYKAIAVNVSDIAAMAASPRFALCALTITDEVDPAWVVELAGGMRECCDEFALSLVGGNLSRGREVTIAVTVTGEVAAGRAVRRDGARPGELIVVTGSLGAGAAGRRLSSARSWSAEERDALNRFARPTPRVGEAGVLAARGATAMIDVSDGLAKDLSRLCAASGCGARIRLDAVPVSDDVVAAADALRLDPLELALGGGEDYELLAALDATVFDRAREELDERFGVTFTELGVMIDEGLVAVTADGERPLEPKGWDHFA
jgi:thiamine-monophosphate kinase